MYNKYFYGHQFVDNNLIFGEPRSIRSDEWMIGSNLYIFSHKYIHGQTDTDIQSPIAQELKKNINSWTNVFRPTFITYSIPNLDLSFSFNFLLRLLLFIFAIYKFGEIFFANKSFFKFSLMFITLFSPFFQWWYATSIVELVTYGSLIILLALNILKDDKPLKYRIFNSIGLFYFLVAFAILFYPPFQITYFYFAISLFIGFILNKNYNLKKILQYFIKYYLVIIFMTIIAIGGYFWEYQKEFNALQNTSYPGQRIISSGGYDWRHFFNGFYNIQLLDDVKGSASFGNQSEASTFFLLFPVLIPYILYKSFINYRKKKKIDYILLFVSLYLTVMIMWMFGFLPQIIGNILLLNLVPHNRAMFGVGLASTFLMLYFIHKKDFGRPNIKYVLVATIIFLLLHLEMGYWFRQNYPLFIQSIPKIVIISIIAAGSVFLLLRRNVKSFLILITFFSFISTYRVNPIYSGTAVITDSPVSHAIKSIEAENKDKSMWIIYDNFIMPNYFTANGASVLNGTHTFPKLELWKKFDPSGKYFDVYNRFAHVKFSTHEKNNVVFTLDQPDTFTVKINPCSNLLTNLNVNYHVFNEEKKFSCLNLVEKIVLPEIRLYIYKHK